MDRYKKRYKTHLHPMKYAPSLILLLILLITIGYSASVDSLSVSDMVAHIRLEKVIRLTDFRVLNVSNGATTGYNKYSFDTAIAGVTLPSANSTVTFQVQVTNLGNVEMGIHRITGIPSNMVASFVGYTVEATLCDSNNNSQCTLGSVTTFQMTIGYTENGFDSNNTTYDLDLFFDFQEMIYTARIGTKYYETIQDAIDDSPTDGTETTIVLLKNVYQRIQIWRGNNIVLDMANLVLHNKEFAQNSSGDPVVEIFGARDKAHPSSDNTSNVGSAVFKMINGTISTEANQGAINVERGGTFIMTGGNILASGNRQAVYIKSGGTASISGTSYLRATAEPAPTASPPNYRATVHNAAGTLTITGGTIEAVGNNGIALMSESTTTIGTKDGTMSTTVPTFIGKDTGIRVGVGTTFNFYDGVAKGQVSAIINENEVDDIETGYDIVHAGDTINGVNYYTIYLGSGVTLSYDLDGGSQDEVSRVVAPGQPVGALPVPTKTGFIFDGWHDANDNLMGPNSTISTNTTYTAKWIDMTDHSVAKIGDTKYETLPLAIAAVPENTQTTITMLDDTELSAVITISANLDIILDLKNRTIDTTAGTVFENYGTLEIQDSGNDGTITGGKVVSGVQYPIIVNKSGGTVYITDGLITTSKSQVIDNSGVMNITGGKISIGNFSQGVINNNGGAILNVSGGEITALVAGSKRQAIYNKGTVTISGNAILASASTDRATVQNDASGARITISGGTITSTNTNCQRGAVQNGSGTLIVTSGTIISNSTYSSNGPSGIQNAGTLRIGTQGGGISITDPVIRSAKVGVYNTGTLDIYDGIIQSKGALISGNIRNTESNSTPATGSELIGDQTYNTWYLVSTAP